MTTIPPSMQVAAWATLSDGDLERRTYRIWAHSTSHRSSNMKASLPWNSKYAARRLLLCACWFDTGRNYSSFKDPAFMSLPEEVNGDESATRFYVGQMHEMHVRRLLLYVDSTPECVLKSPHLVLPAADERHVRLRKFPLFPCRSPRSTSLPVIGETFGVNNRLRSQGLQVQPVTCWHSPVFSFTKLGNIL